MLGEVKGEPGSGAAERAMARRRRSQQLIKSHLELLLSNSHVKTNLPDSYKEESWRWEDRGEICGGREGEIRNVGRQSDCSTCLPLLIQILKRQSEGGKKKITLKDDGGTEKVCQCHGAARLRAQPAISGRKERKKEKKERRQYNQL